MKVQFTPRRLPGIKVASLTVVMAMTLGVAIVHAKAQHGRGEAKNEHGKAKHEKGKAQHVRWDIIQLTAGPTVNPGGQASAQDNIGDTITFTGTGTFVAPSDDEGTSDDVTGGGSWTIVTAGGSSTGSYVVRGLVSWEPAPGNISGCCR